MQSVSMEDAVTLWSAVETLSGDLRAVVVLFYYEDMSIKEISGITGVSQGAVKTRLSRARAKLRSMLAPEGEAGNEYTG